MTTCMGRGSFVRKTAPSILRDTRVGYCIVDYSCPEHIGDVLERDYRACVEGGRLLIVRCPGHTTFHKTRAQNLGARAVLERGATTIGFADADTMVLRGALDDLLGAVTPGRFAIVGRTARGRSPTSLTGVIALHADDFERSRGFDEAFVGWGHEDLEFRMRLRFELGLSWHEVSPHLFRALPHSNALRVAHASEKNLLQSSRRNGSLLHDRIRRWSTLPTFVERDLRQLEFR